MQRRSDAMSQAQYRAAREEMQALLNRADEATKFQIWRMMDEFNTTHREPMPDSPLQRWEDPQRVGESIYDPR